jgi:hypothetical protein
LIDDRQRQRNEKTFGAWEDCEAFLSRLGYRSHEPNEPPHVHVDRDDQSAKFWLKPIALVCNLGFSPVELRGIQRILKENESSLLEKWNARFRN